VVALALAGCGDSGDNPEPVAPQAVADGAAELTRAASSTSRASSPVHRPRGVPNSTAAHAA
jgi:hypothetical protein